jgi:hypothetical protein
MKIHLSWLALASTLFGAGHVHAIEEPNFTVVRTHSGFEVRDYAPYVVAEVTVPGPEADAGNQGFRILAAYIFGKNAGQQSIAMTAPVTQAAEPVKIAMTAPVTQNASGDGAGFVIRFTMPAAYTLETLPKPLDENIRLVAQPAARYAVLRFTGFWTQANYDEHLLKLQTLMAKQGQTPLGDPVYARYDAPFVPWFWRRNEIWMPVR